MHGTSRRVSSQRMRWKPWAVTRERMSSVMDKRFQRRLRSAGTNRYFHISSPGYHRDSQLPRKLPRQGQVQLEDQGARQRGGAHLVWDLWPSQGRFLEGEHHLLWLSEYNSNPSSSSDQGSDRKALWNIRWWNWRGPPCFQQGQNSEGSVQVQQEEERWWLQMPGLSSVWILVQLLQWLPQIAAFAQITGSGSEAVTGTGSGW